MSALILDGHKVAATRRRQLKEKISQQCHRPPGLAVILIGQDPASGIYVKNKRNACEQVGILSYSFDLPEQMTQHELIELIHELNQTEHIDGILIQLPLPSHINEQIIIEQIKPEKDVDGFHPYNLGRLAQGNPFLRPCTPLGVMNLLSHYGLEVKGRHAVVVGASNIVGRPMSLELLMAGATVTICHSHTQNLQKFIEMADIVVVAVGKIDVVQASWFHADQIIIDIGIHRLSSHELRGDVSFDEALDKVAYITPVPGGVGPMTVVSLLENTFTATLRNQESA